MATCKILLCGDVRGRFDQLIRRVSSVNNANGPFDVLLCVGQFFPDDRSHIDEVMQFVEGNYEIPIPTYFIGDYGQVASEALSDAKRKVKDIGLICEGIPVCKNLYWLKGSGIIYLKGLRVAFLSGKDIASVYHDASGAQSQGAFYEDDVDALRAYADESHLNDLFLSNEWPQGVLNGVEGPLGLDSSNTGSSIVAELVVELKPRYHVAGSKEVFYARDPYRNKDGSHVTRFVGLGAVGNAKKQKFLHALSLTPAASMAVKELTLQPLNTTKSPYAAPTDKPTSKPRLNSKPAASLSDGEGQYWRYSTPKNNMQRTAVGGGDKVCFEFMLKGSCSRGETCTFKHEKSTEKPLLKGACFELVTKGKCSKGSDCKFRHNLDEENANAEDIRTRSSTPCWFCLASPNIDTHLVIDVGDHCYCALAKGGIVDGHVLLVPIEHVSSMLSLSKSALGELNKYKRTLQKLYKSQGKASVIFERCVQFKGGTHAHIQVVPIPLSKSFQVRNDFLLAAKELGIAFDDIPEEDDFSIKDAVKSHAEGQSNYFIVELPGAAQLVHVLEPGENIPVQFGREVCAKVLGVPERSDWRACKLSKEEEKVLAEKFRKEFDGMV